MIDELDGVVVTLEFTELFLELLGCDADPFLGDFCLGKLEYGLMGKCIFADVLAGGDGFLPSSKEIVKGVVLVLV